MDVSLSCPQSCVSHAIDRLRLGERLECFEGCLRLPERLDDRGDGIPCIYVKKYKSATQPLLQRTKWLP